MKQVENQDLLMRISLWSYGGEAAGATREHGLCRVHSQGPAKSFASPAMLPRFKCRGRGAPERPMADWWVLGAAGSLIRTAADSTQQQQQQEELRERVTRLAYQHPRIGA